MPFQEANIEPFMDAFNKLAPPGVKETTGLSPASSTTSSDSRRKSKTVLIEKNGKQVSRTSTGKRKFHNKSKMGCDTCKRRRVKCDEGKPICKKCENMGIDCHYSLPSSKPATPAPKKAKKAKKATASPMVKVTASTPSSSRSTPKTLQQEIDANRYQSNDDDTDFPDTIKIEGHNLSIPTFTVNKSPMQPQRFDPTKLPLDAIKSAMMSGDLSVLNNIPSLSSLGTFAGVNLGSLASMGNLGNLSNLGNLGNLGELGSLPVLSKDNSMTSGNNLSVNLGDMTNNPTISPQPSMSPGSQTSPLSAHQTLHDHRSHTSYHEENSHMNQSQRPNTSPYSASPSLNSLDLRLMYHYTTVVAPTITTAGISEQKIWSADIPELAFNYPFLMHSILAFAATHLSRTVKSLEQSVTHHRGEALRLLREAVLEISSDNTDALVASALILIMDSLANASLPSASSLTSLPASAWIFHVKGAATILTAVWPLPPTSRFYKFISVDLSDLGDIINEKNGSISELVCFDDSIADLYPVEFDSPYLITLAYLDKLHHEKFKSDFILRIFAFPALLDKTFLALLMSGDLSAMRIMRSYYSLLRGFTTEMKDKVWFLEGVSKVLPADVDDYSGGGGMHMMLDFLGGGLPSMTTTNLAPGLNIDINDHFMNP